MLRAEVISQLSPKDRLIEEWGRLADECASATVFQTPEWLATWWRLIGATSGGRTLAIVAMRDGADLVGLAPLMLSAWNRLPIRRVSFLGAGVTDYNDVIAAPGLESDVCECLYAVLRSLGDWSILDFRDLRDGGILRTHAPSAQSGLNYSEWPLEPCPYLPIPQSVPAGERWDALLAGYSKKTRSNIGYYERNLRRAFKVEMAPASTVDDLPEAFDALFELHRRRWNKRWLPGVFGSAKVRSFHTTAARGLLTKGALRLHTLRLDGEVQAALYGFAYHDRTCYYQGGFEPEMARYSPGTVLAANAIRTACEEGFETFDFLRGNEEYKQRWTGGTHRTNIRRLIGRAGSPHLAVAERLHALENRLETKAKDLFAGGLVRRARKQAGGDRT